MYLEKFDSSLWWWESSLKFYISRVAPIRLRMQTELKSEPWWIDRKPWMMFEWHEKCIGFLQTKNEVNEPQDSPFSNCRNEKWIFQFITTTKTKKYYVIEFNWVECKWSHCSSVWFIRYVFDPQPGILIFKLLSKSLFFFFCYKIRIIFISE